MTCQSMDFACLRGTIELRAPRNTTSTCVQNNHESQRTHRIWQLQHNLATNCTTKPQFNTHTHSSCDAQPACFVCIYVSMMFIEDRQCWFVVSDLHLSLICWLHECNESRFAFRIRGNAEQKQVVSGSVLRNELLTLESHFD